MPVLLIGLLVGAWAWARNAPPVGTTRMQPAPRTDSSGRVYYLVEQWNGSQWIEYGRRYLGP